MQIRPVTPAPPLVAPPPGVGRRAGAGTAGHGVARGEVVLSGELLRAPPGGGVEGADPWRRAQRLEEHPGYQRSRFVPPPPVRQALSSYRELESIRQEGAAPRPSGRYDFYA